MSAVLLPNLNINDTSVRADRQQCILRPSKAAYQIKIKQKNVICAPCTPSQKLLWSEETAVEEARRLGKVAGQKEPNEREYLGQLLITFGKYVNNTFKWLLENDVGYVKYLLDHHAKEMKKQGTVRDAWLKNYLKKYVTYFPAVSSHLEENIDVCVYGIHPCKEFTYQEMFDLYYKHKTDPSSICSGKRNLAKQVYDQVRRWLCMLPDQISTNAMKRFQVYIKDKEKSKVPVKEIKFSPTKFDVAWSDDSSIFEAISLNLEAETNQQPVTPVKRLSHVPTATVSKAPDSTLSEQSKSLIEESSQKDLSLVVYEGWHKSWEEEAYNSIPPQDLHWLKDSDRGLFQPTQTFRDIKGNLRTRKVLKNDTMWFYPPEPPGVIKAAAHKPDAFFHGRVFFWRPVGVWGYKISCPRPDCPERESKTASLYRNGYHSRARQICDITDWYTMLCEVLSCAACNQKYGINTRFVTWEYSIVSSLSESHQSLFPAILTARRGVDKKIIQLMVDRSIGNTTRKMWRQVVENHSLQYLQRKDLYTTLLHSLTKKGGIVKSFAINFKPPPKRKDPPSAKLFQRAFLISEAEKVDDYRNQIMSTFGKILKFDSTKKICKKISGAGKGTAEWCTNIGNGNSQILSFVLTCEESTEKLKPMAESLMDRYKTAGEDPPLVMFVDRGCCRKYGPSSVEKLFDFWVDSGMCVRLDAWHWIHRFDAAVRTDSHPKYPAFKSALSGALFAYNRSDLNLLIRAVRAGSPALQTIPESEIINTYITRKQLQHHVRRITVGVQETYNLVSAAISELKTAAGFDSNGIPLFKSDEAIDEVWDNQQKHIECLQDPAGLSFYTVLKYIKLNGIDIPHYRCSRGNNSLEGFHSHLLDMVPSVHCNIQSLQIYLLGGIARWNADRDSENVKGGHGRRHRAYSPTLIHRLNTRCTELFGEEEIEEINFRPLVPPGTELLGVEYLLKQSIPSFDTKEHYSTIINTMTDSPEEEKEEEEEENEDLDEQEKTDPGYESEDETIPDKPATIPVTDLVTAPELDPVMEDVCGSSHLPGFEKVESLSLLLVSLAMEEGSLGISPQLQKEIIETFKILEDHDKNTQKFNLAYSGRWGNTLYKRTSGDPQSAAVIQKVKFGIRYTPAQHIDHTNRILYCVIKQLWLKLNKGTSKKSAAVKNRITQHYQRMQHRVMVEDPILSRLAIPLPKINSKCVAEFIRRQEVLIAKNSTTAPKDIITKETHVTDIEMPQPLELPTVMPVTDRPQIPVVERECLAGAKKLKKRLDITTSQIPVTSTCTSISEPVPMPKLHNIPVSSQIFQPFHLIHSIPSTSIQQLQVIPEISRSKFYKAQKRTREEEEESSSKRKPFVPYCGACKKPNLGHQKYKKKSWCEEMKKSTSKGLSNKTFKDFQEFKDYIDNLN
ncbi:hypothetical protein LOTGIDRAFT_166390 [Lottia gigantea]|uniref:DUF6729 domain-containing protein n=1 Tax=Lottia gigantea TaxID=225164 RepID=V3ZY02_LOTGI|nr:hypothetical protein LOTGIDRAFT_166390 [Lottia gigantea]ESO87510.1 hypothetical protein LOTGIDRAFT_166390 [Lottia gigantea]